MHSFYLLGAKKIFGFIKKAFIVIAVYFIVISLFLYFINKDKSKVTHDPIQKNREEIYKTINDPKLKNTKEGKITIALYRGMLCGLIGEACTNNPKDGDKNFNHSVFGFMTNLIVLPYANPPASGVYWAYSGLQNAGFVPKTYAAEGVGFAAIKPFMNIWKVFRDISYMLLVLVLIAIGFMIMFRAKLNPQTVISVENSLPKIVVALLLITFSFAIAGFLIDLMYVIIILIIGVLSPQLSPIVNKNTQELVSQYLNPRFGDIFPHRFFTEKIFSLGTAMFNILPKEIRPVLSAVLQITSGIVNITIIKKLLGGFEEGGPITKFSDIFTDIGAATFIIGKIPNIIGIILDIVLFIIIAIGGAPVLLGLLVLFTVLFLLFRVFFALFSAYLQIILLIIFSPIILIFEAIPGKGTFSFWFKNLIANLLGFVVVLVLVLVSTIISGTLSNANQLPWMPPFIYGIDGSSISALIGVGIFLLIPDFLKIIKEFLGAKGLPFSFGLGTFFGGVGAGFSAATGGISQITSLSQTPLIGDVIKPIADKLGMHVPKPLSQDYFQDTVLPALTGQKPDHKS